MEYRALFESIRNIIIPMSLSVRALQKQNYDKGIRIFTDVLERLQHVMQMLLANAGQLQSDGILFDAACLMEMLKGLLNAQEQKDYILLADLLELTAIPYFSSLQVSMEQFCMMTEKHSYGENIDTMDDVMKRPYILNSLYANYWEKNKSFLQEKNPKLLKELESVVKEIDVISEEPGSFKWEDTIYSLEETEYGLLTVKITKDKKSYYLHSNKDAIRESENFIEAYFDNSCDSYEILGMGLGYHWNAVARRSFYAKRINLYETDLCMILWNLMVNDLRQSMTDYLTIYYDPKLTKLSEAIKGNVSGFIIHYPSLRNMNNKELRNSFERFFISDNSWRNHKDQLEINFQSNMKVLSERNTTNTIDIVDDFLENMRGKTVCIVAAGPSLDKNIQDLLEYRKKNENIFVLATGTVLYKMTQMQFRPDAVIFTDSNKRIFHQLRANRDDDIPMLLLSTAYFEFARKYQGPRYLILQKEFEPSETYAMKHKLWLYNTGGSVATTALDVALHARSEKVIFIGLDLAFTDNLAHAWGTSDRTATDSESLIPIKSFDGGTVLADYKFIMYREWIEKRIQDKDVENIPIINATEGGCYLKGAKHCTLEEALQ